MPIYIWIKIIKIAINIGEDYNYGLIMSWSFLLNTTGLLLFLFNLSLEQFNLTSLISIILFSSSLIINFKKVGPKNFIVFTLGQILSLITIFFIIAAIGSALKKLSETFSGKNKG